MELDLERIQNASEEEKLRQFFAGNYMPPDLEKKSGKIIETPEELAAICEQILKECNIK